MSTPTTLALPNSIKPKPSRADLIEAMVKRAEVLHAKASAEFSAKMKNLRQAFEQEALSTLKAGKFEIRRISDPDEDGSCITVVIQSPKLRKLAKAWEDGHSDSPGRFDAKEVSKKVTERLKGHIGGAAAILSNEESVRQIDQFLTGNAA